ncbi:MAG: bifunctional pyr operon transcriptional regulator/uracil phosphoribosyltransferase PyrR [Verrucomicrobiales bacterium]|nr:bifunctional pyr operon transcriptional regulator/uracil phosphoribosyltransferase PyrR [Verrucomicrobiales bacterium]
MSDSTKVHREEILDPKGIEARVTILADEVQKRTAGKDVAFVGIYTRGVTLARRVAKLLSERGVEIPVGTLDISLYRDDFDNRGTELPRLESSDISFPIDGTRVILFDEVIFTGRTIRAALDGLMDYGRPSKIELAVLVDRGHREIPIQPDYVGERVESRFEQYVKVRFEEDDDKEGVFLETRKEDTVDE